MDPNTLSEIPNGLAVLYAVYIAAALWRSRSRAPGMPATIEQPTHTAKQVLRKRRLTHVSRF
jgi:hypothetical protein